MLDLLPEDVFGDQRNAPTIAVPESLNGGESLERVVVQQLLLSERIYMKDLERLQVCLFIHLMHRGLSR
jgi:hypothetical protein